MELENQGSCSTKKKKIEVVAMARVPVNIIYHDASALTEPFLRLISHPIDSLNHLFNINFF